MLLIWSFNCCVPAQRQPKLKTEDTHTHAGASLYLSLTIHGWITPRNHELFNFHLEKLSSRSSYYERICSIGYNSHLNRSLHLLEGIRAGAFNKRLNLSDKWDKCIHDLFLLFAALIPSEGIPPRTCLRNWVILHRSVKLDEGPFGPAGRWFTGEKQLEKYSMKVTEPRPQRQGWRYLESRKGKREGGR